MAEFTQEQLKVLLAMGYQDRGDTVRRKDDPRDIPCWIWTDGGLRRDYSEREFAPGFYADFNNIHDDTEKNAVHFDCPIAAAIWMEIELSNI